MSKQDLIKVMMAYATHEDFQRLLTTQPELALAPYNLTAEEREAIITRDQQKIASVLGTDYNNFNLTLNIKGDKDRKR